ncbi:MAG: glycerate 2-kinase [Chloroflexota bacterium]|jgi:glycerate kinase|nr:glycerate 2-kinase [Chloroflexota bacterium]MEA2668359.1 glycerate 2-kinase [Chloroflexota bacterium]
MRIVVAPNAFKGSLSAVEAAEAIGEGIRVVARDAELVLVPIADGGDGTVDALVAATQGERRTLRVRGPLSDPVDAEYGLIDGGSTAVIEMAKAAGLALVPTDKRDPRVTTTHGVGELLQHAYDDGARRFIVGIGGSATNDGGAGMAQALGYHLLDENGLELPPGGLALKRLARIQVGGVHANWKETEVDVACDVTNPLTGPRGASAVYGPQKGATPEMVAELDEALHHFAEIIRRDLGVDVEQLPGAGAAGGLGAGLVAFLGARLQPGAEMVMQALHLDERLAGAQLVITGEGRLDSQTARFGKGPAAVARHAKNAGIPVVAIGGSLADETELRLLFDGLEATVVESGRLDEAIAQARPLLVRAATRLMWLVLTGRRLR